MGVCICYLCTQEATQAKTGGCTGTQEAFLDLTLALALLLSESRLHAWVTQLGSSIGDTHYSPHLLISQESANRKQKPHSTQKAAQHTESRTAHRKPHTGGRSQRPANNEMNERTIFIPKYARPLLSHDTKSLSPQDSLRKLLLQFASCLSDCKVEW